MHHTPEVLSGQALQICDSFFETGKTQEILKQFAGTEADITISTKSDLIIRDLELLKQIKRLTVAFSINTVDEENYPKLLSLYEVIYEKKDNLNMVNYSYHELIRKQ